MECQNCANEIHVNDKFQRAGKNSTVFCSRDCAHEAFEGYYTKKQINKTMESRTHGLISK